MQLCSTRGCFGGTGGCGCCSCQRAPAWTHTHTILPVLHANIRLAQLALPASTCGVLMYAARLAIMSKVGSLGSLSQGQLALAQTTYNISGLSWCVGVERRACWA